MPSCHISHQTDTAMLNCFGNAKPDTILLKR